MEPISKLFSRFRDTVVKVIPKLIQANAASRDELIDVVSDLAGELQEGLGLAATYIRGARHLDSPEDLTKHFLQAEQALYRYHSEFKICKGLRKLRDRFNRMFDALPYSLEIGTRQQIEGLLFELERDENMILEEFKDFWPRIQATIAAGPIDVAKAAIDAEVSEVKRKSDHIGEIAREILSTF